jgi:hypothetical protein
MQINLIIIALVVCISSIAVNGDVDPLSEAKILN